jgi:hypothetical protein
MKHNYKLILFFCLAAISSKTYSQGSFGLEKFRLTTSLGASAYLGDLRERSPILKDASPAISLGISYDIMQQLRARLNISYMKVKASDADADRTDFQARNLSFESSVFEVAALAEYDVLDRETYSTVPYIFAGPGIFHFNPKAYNPDGALVALQPLGTEGQGLPSYPDRKPYSLTQFNLQFGFGARFEISETVSLGAEFAYRFLFTDYLDDVSLTYPKLTEFIAGGASAETIRMSYRADQVNVGDRYTYSRHRGSSGGKDVYYSVQLTATFNLDNLINGGNGGSSGGGAFGGKRTSPYKGRGYRF